MQVFYFHTFTEAWCIEFSCTTTSRFIWSSGLVSNWCNEDFLFPQKLKVGAGTIVHHRSNTSFVPVALLEIILIVSVFGFSTCLSWYMIQWHLSFQYISSFLGREVYGNCILNFPLFSILTVCDRSISSMLRMYETTSFASIWLLHEHLAYTGCCMMGWDTSSFWQVWSHTVKSDTKFSKSHCSQPQICSIWPSTGLQTNCIRLAVSSLSHWPWSKRLLF